MHRSMVPGLAILLIPFVSLARQHGSIRCNPSQTAVTNSALRPSDHEFVTIPAGTRIPISLVIGLHTRVAHRGDTVYFETRLPVYVDGQLAIPAGVSVEGVIDKIGKPDSAPRTGGLQIRPTRLVFS